jgi:hypothetical protein
LASLTSQPPSSFQRVDGPNGGQWDQCHLGDTSQLGWELWHYIAKLDTAPEITLALE